MKKLIIFITFLSIASILFGQERITLTTTRTGSASITMAIEASAADRADVWIDLNNNGVRDSGEEVSAWGTQETYAIQSQTITVYGKVTSFNCQNQGLTSLDLTNAPYLTFLRVDNNSIEELDLSALPKEFYNLHISRNKLKGVLDVSHLEELQTMNIDRNYFTSITMGNHPTLGRNINISRNLFSETAIDAILAAIPNRTDAQSGNFYLINTAASDAQWEEGNQLKQHHLAHQVFTDYNWSALDVNEAANFSDIVRLTNKYTTSFTTASSAESQITLNIQAETSDEASVWIDLNGNGTKDGNESVMTFGSDVTYEVSSPDVTIYGLASKISATNNQLTKFDASKNPFLAELNVALNNFTIEELNKLIESLEDRTSTTRGTLILLDTEGDANQVTSDHISQANAKNWEVKDGKGRVLSPSDIVTLKQSIQNFSDMATYPGQVVTLPESTDQDLIITYSLKTENGEEIVAKLEGNVLTSLSYGEVSITASQAGNDLYEELSKTITVTVMSAGETFDWLSIPTIGVIGNEAFIAGSQEDISIFTKFYINDTPVDIVENSIDLTDYEGNLELKATNTDGSQIIRLVIKR